MSNFLKITSYAKKQESVTIHMEKKNQATEIAYERGQILDLAGKNQINYLKKSMITLSNQMENINKEMEIIKKKTQTLPPDI